MFISESEDQKLPGFPRQCIICDMNTRQKNIYSRMSCTFCLTEIKLSQNEYFRRTKLYLSGCHIDFVTSQEFFYVAIIHWWEGRAAFLKIFDDTELTNFSNGMHKTYKRFRVKNNNMKMAIKDAKKIAPKNTKSNEIKISAGFDCSWNSPGYQAKDEIVPANSESTGNNVDVFHKI